MDTKHAHGITFIFFKLTIYYIKIVDLSKEPTNKRLGRLRAQSVYGVQHTFAQMVMLLRCLSLITSPYIMLIIIKQFSLFFPMLSCQFLDIHNVIKLFQNNHIVVEYSLYFLNKKSDRTDNLTIKKNIALDIHEDTSILQSHMIAKARGKNHKIKKNI